MSDVAENADPPASPLRAFVALAGGGARGVVHVGAVRALERQGLEVWGWAGTSAGALIATLAAAGFRADDLVAEDGTTTILSALHDADPRIHRVTDLFGWGGWPAIWAFRTLAPVLGWMFVAFVVAALGLPLWAVFDVAHHAVHWDWPIWAWTALFTVVGAASLVALSGLAGLGRLNRTLGRLLQRRLFPGEPARTVRMRDFDGRARPALKIVASNLKSRDLQLFSSDSYGDTPVADAVCASICLPVIFRLWRIAGIRFVDGGIVSNLPAWPFDEERALNPDALTLAFDIPGSAKPRPPGLVTWLPAMIQTGFFGRAELNLRGVRRVELFELETTLGVLDFDLELPRLLEAVGDATNAAQAAINRRLFREPEVLVQACAALRRAAQDVLTAASPGVVGSDAPGRVRAAVALCDRGFAHTVRRRHCDGFEPTDGDEAALLSIDGEGPGEAWRSGVPELEQAAGGDLVFERAGGDLGRPAWRGVRWRLSVPISDTDAEGRLRKLLVLLDGDALLSDTEAAEDLMTPLATMIKTFFADVLAGLSDGTERNDGEA